MITGNPALDTTEPIETALARLHTPWAKPAQIRGSARYLQPDLIKGKRISRQDFRLAAALGLIVTMCQCLIRHYDQKSQNQKARAAHVLKMAERLLKKAAQRIPDQDILAVGQRIDVLNTRLGFDEQPSWMVYIGLAIAILGDAYPDLYLSRLAEYRDEVDETMAALVRLHDYLAKKEKPEATAHDARATELYSLWADLF